MWGYLAAIWAYFGLFWGDLGSAWGGLGPKIAPSWLKMAPRLPQDDAKMATGGSTRFKIASHRLKRLKKPYPGLSMNLENPREAPESIQDAT